MGPKGTPLIDVKDTPSSKELTKRRETRGLTARRANGSIFGFKSEI